jgi:hypothetical protein
MRGLAALVVVALVGVSCSTAVRWQKAGVGAAEQQRDETACTGLANRESTVPTASGYGTGTTTSTPLDPQRNRIQPYDAGVFEECMRTRGYERVPATP